VFIANLENERFFLRLIRQGKLEVTRSGRAFNLLTKREIGCTQRDNVYRKLSWADKDGKIIQVQLHRLVWAVFKGLPKDPELRINHIDGIKSNCRLSNLELTDDSGNNKHALRLGLSVPLLGEAKPNACFLDKEVIRFRKLYAAHKITVAQVANVKGIHKVTAHMMLMGKTYKHLL
jgi:HNH endonuclease